MRDEIVIGLSPEEFEGVDDSDVESLARVLHRRGYVAAWEYGVGRDADGATSHVARQRICMFAAGILRIESLAPAHPIAPPPQS